MNAALCKEFGAVDDVISVGEHPKPVLVQGKGQMMIRVLACSLSPGDTRTINGSVDFVRTPPSFPYVIGHDICGIVEELDPKDKSSEHFKVGDCIVTTSPDVMMKGGLAEYALVKTAPAAIKPAFLSPLEACSLPTSAQRALQAVRQTKVEKGDRVLVLGGSGGFGTFLVQILHDLGAYIVATSTQRELLESLGVDEVLDYTVGKWWEMEEYKKSPFKVIFDCSPCHDPENIPWKVCGPVIKSRKEGGFFLAVTMDTPDMEIHNLFQIIGLLGPVLTRSIYTSFWPGCPKYQMLAAAQRREDLYDTFKLVEEKKLRVIFDPASPLPFTTEGVRQACNLINNKHAHGKVAIEIASESS